jgi:hypothetical protein
VVVIGGGVIGVSAALELTARGEWRIKGEPIDNASIREFIARNYARDDQGNWFFQNGPQRVFVAIEATPLIYRLDGTGRLQAHTGAHPRELRSAFTDADGRLLLVTDLGPGLIDGRDATTCAERLVDGQGHALDEHWLERWMALVNPPSPETRSAIRARIAGAGRNAFALEPPTDLDLETASDDEIAMRFLLVTFRQIHEATEMAWRLEQPDAIAALVHHARAELAVGGPTQLGALLSANQYHLRAIGVSHPLLDALCTAAEQAGALGAKLAGAGWGGVMLALCTTDRIAPVRAAIAAAGAVRTYHVQVAATGVE